MQTQEKIDQRRQLIMKNLKHKLKANMSCYQEGQPRLFRVEHPLEPCDVEHFHNTWTSESVQKLFGFNGYTDVDFAVTFEQLPDKPLSFVVTLKCIDNIRRTDHGSNGGC
jgi:hypothetical protein